MRVPLVLAALLVPMGHVEAQTPSYLDFVRSFDQARGSDDRAGMTSAVVTWPDHALSHFVALCWDRWRNPRDEDLGATLDAIKVAWGEAFRTQNLVRRVEQFVRNQNQEAAARLQLATRKLKRCPADLVQAQRSTDRSAFLAVREVAEEQADLFEELGDVMQAAEAWGTVAQVLSLIPERTEAEQDEMMAALERFLQLRESWDWMHDSAYAQNFAFLRVEQRRMAGQLAREEALIPELDSLVAAGAEERVFDLEFAMLETQEPDMFVLGGPVPTLWANVTQMREAPEQLPYFKRVDLFMVRQAGQRFGITTDAASRSGRDHATTVRASTRPRPSLFYLDDEKTQPYAMWFFTGSEKERFMQAYVNLVPTRERAFVFYRSASSWTTSIDGEKVVFYDDNGDGRLFTADPYGLNIHLRTLGKVEQIGTRVPAYDSMRIGRGPRIPFSEAVQIRGTWYHLRGVEDGTKAGIRPMDPAAFKTGEVQLVWQGVRRVTPELMIIQGRGMFAPTAFDISSGKPVQVPAGDYEISFGRIVVGRNDRIQMAQIFKGESEVFTIEEGKTLSLEMGAPFRIEFELEGGDRDIAIDASKLRVLDKFGAQYATLHGAVLTPDVVASINPDGRNARVYGGFTPVVDAELALIFAQRSPLLNLSAISFPMPKQAQGQNGDLVLRLTLPARGMVVGVRQDRHPLFGKLEPVFK